MDTDAIRASLAGQSAPPSSSIPPASKERRKGSRRPSLISGFVQRFSGPANWVRSYPRHSCCIVGVLVILGRNVPVDGLVTEISLGGALFRPASDFIFDRNGAEIALRFADRELRGVIVNIRRKGYGIRWDNIVTQEEVDDITARFGLAMPLMDD
jgi:hypothetical protein